MISLINKHRHIFDSYGVKYLRLTNTEKHVNDFSIKKLGDQEIIYLYNTESPDKEFITAVFCLAAVLVTRNQTTKFTDCVGELLDIINEPLTNEMLIHSLKLVVLIS